MRLRAIMLFSAIAIWTGCSNPVLRRQTVDLLALGDTVSVIANPDKGWYHHLFDNGTGKYLLENDEVLSRFPGMDHLYLRLCWAYLEPEEGKYDWHYIDDIVEKYVPMGYGISFRISCKETGTVPGSAPYEIDGIRYATPMWVKEAGAKGIDRPPFGSPYWTPEWDDPVFLEKLENFHRAFAAKYDGKPWVRYIDIGSIGDWGEGHTYASTRTRVTIEQIKMHTEMYLRCYHKSPLVVSDDLIANSISAGLEEQTLEYFLSNGISLRDDSPMVEGYMKNDLATWTVRHPSYFAEAYRTMPVVFEPEHYHKVKNNGYWLGTDGAGIIPEFGVSGAEVFTQAIRMLHATYIGYHGYMKDWLDDNPTLTGKLLNLCGYWYFPVRSEIEDYRHGRLNFTIDWENKGVAPAYDRYEMKVRLVDTAGSRVVRDMTIIDSGNRAWKDGETTSQSYSIRVGNLPRGEYSLRVKLTDPVSGRIVKTGIAETAILEDSYFEICRMAI